MFSSCNQLARQETRIAIFNRSVWAALLLFAVDSRVFADELVDYRKQIKPILASRCVACHGVLKQEGSLRLDTAAFVMKGGDSGAALIAGSPDDSLLLKRITAHEQSERMPPEGEPLKSDQITAIRDWVLQNAVAPLDESPERDPREHWAFKPIVRPSIPLSADSSTGRKKELCNPIDAFIAFERLKHGIEPQPATNRRTWLRRVSFDLIGLPPTTFELDEFANDESPDAYERIVERLLNSPQYGERWGRHWMDVWRYSDWWGLGEEVRNSQKHIWHWRDWIIESLNADKGYDQMLCEMLAADELYPNDLDRLRATGYLARQYFIFNRTTWLDECVEHTSKGMLGLTLNCAKCHDHKYDPLSHVEYYSMRAIFEPYQIRTEMVNGQIDPEKDGIPRTFDAHLDIPTYVHLRGDDQRPDKTRVIQPAVPAILTTNDLRLSITPVSLPPEAPYPGLRTFVVSSHRNTAQQKVAESKAALEIARKALVESQTAEKEYAARIETAQREGDQRTIADEKALRDVDSGGPVSAAAAIVFYDNFFSVRPSDWQPVSGNWNYHNGRLEQIGDGRAALRLKKFPHHDFEVRLRYLPKPSFNWKWIGFAFDLTNDGGEIFASVSGIGEEWKSQIALKQNGNVVHPVTVKHASQERQDKPHQLVLRVRGGLLNLSFNDQDVVAFRLPDNHPRQPGTLELVTLDATVQMLSFEISPLGFDTKLVDTLPSQKKPLAKPAPPTFTPVHVAQLGVNTAEKACLTAEAALASIETRAVADHIVHGDALASTSISNQDANSLSSLVKTVIQSAIKSETALAVARADEDVSRAELAIAQAKPDKKVESEKKLVAAKSALDAAIKALNTQRETHTPLPGAKKTQEDYQNRNADVPFPKSSSGRRTAFAKWLTDPRHPLPARVAVNHIWARHLGKPLVSTVFDFGRKGTLPTHPELLDWLATEFVDHNWSMKHLHRLIVLSETYRLSSSSAGAADATLSADPENRWYWRMNSVRMDAQVIRDSLLSLAGDLDSSMYGPSIAIKDEVKCRRSLYFVHSHNDHQKFLSTFDDANVLECYRRAESIVPQQALALENSPFVTKNAQRIAECLGNSGSAGSDEEFVKIVYRSILSIEPTADELVATLEMLNRMTQLARAKNRTNPEQVARTSIVLTLLNLNDFITIR